MTSRDQLGDIDVEFVRDVAKHVERRLSLAALPLAYGRLRAPDPTR